MDKHYQENPHLYPALYNQLRVGDRIQLNKNYKSVVPFHHSVQEYAKKHGLSLNMIYTVSKVENSRYFHIEGETPAVEYGFACDYFEFAVISTCEWKSQKTSGLYDTQCGEKSVGVYARYRYCPYCSRKIIKEEEK